MSPIYLASLALLVLCAVLAIWRGGAWERATVVILAIVWAVTTVTPFDGANPAWAVIIMDGCVALYLLYGAVFSERRWTLWAAAFQILLMANHLAFVRFPAIQQWAYVTAYYLWTNAVMVALAVGTLTRKHRVNTPASPQDDENGRR